MTKTTTKTLPKKIATNKAGIFYKEVQQTTTDDKGKVTSKIVDKVYVIRYRDFEGKEKLVTLGKFSEGIRIAYCKEKLDEYVTLARNGEMPPQLKKRHKVEITTLNDIAKIYFDDKANENKSNVKQSQKYEIHIKPVLGDTGIDSIKKPDIRKLQDDLKASKAPKTVNGIIQLLTAIFNHQIKDYDAQIVNPCTGIKRLKVNDARERYLTQSEVKQLLDAVKDNQQLELFTKLALTTGARLDAIMHMQKKDFNLDHNSVTLKDLKSDGTYTGFYDDSDKVYIMEYIAPLKANTYLMGKSTTPQHPRTIQRHLKTILDELFNQDLEVRDTKNRVVIHSLRHTFASHLAINGTPIFTIQKLMNHSDITMTMRYAKLAPDSGRNAVKGLYND